MALWNLDSMPDEMLRDYIKLAMKKLKKFIEWLRVNLKETRKVGMYSMPEIVDWRGLGS